MDILADYEKRNIRMMKNRSSAKTLRTLTTDEAFHFASPHGYAGYAAYSLDQFCDLLRVVPADRSRTTWSGAILSTGLNIRLTMKNWPKMCGTAQTRKNCTA